MSCSKNILTSLLHKLYLKVLIWTISTFSLCLRFSTCLRWQPISQLIIATKRKSFKLTMHKLYNNRTKNTNSPNLILEAEIKLYSKEKRTMIKEKWNINGLNKMNRKRRRKTKINILHKQNRSSNKLMKIYRSNMDNNFNNKEKKEGNDHSIFILYGSKSLYFFIYWLLNFLLQF